MHTDQEPYRELYEAILDYEGDELYADVVRPWVSAHAGERAWLKSFAERPGHPIPEATIEDLWRLYALSRIVDLLQLGLAPSGRDREGGWGVRHVRYAEYVELMESFGLRRIDREAFHPFFHEIVTVAPIPDAAAGITLVQEYWPGYMLGPLLITRAGCEVAAGAGPLTKEIAESSTMYWAFARRTRPTADLSNGWGSNSAWRTAFRRDYALGGSLHYNVDGKGNPALDDDLEPAERLELLRFRSFVRCAKPHDDRFPYHDRYVEQGGDRGNGA